MELSNITVYYKKLWNLKISRPTWNDLHGNSFNMEFIRIKSKFQNFQFRISDLYSNKLNKENYADNIYFEIESLLLLFNIV